MDSKSTSSHSRSYVDPNMVTFERSPIQLRSLEGLSLVAGLVGEPKETDEYTKNLTNINVAHVKVHADLTSPLPPVIELKRKNGEVFPVSVEYPWTPPSCSFCKQIGHIQKDCLLFTFAWVPADKTKNTDQPSTSNTQETPVVFDKAQGKEKEHDQTPESHSTIPSPVTNPVTEPVTNPPTLPNPATKPSTIPPKDSIPLTPSASPLASSSIPISECPSSSAISDPLPSSSKRQKLKHKQSLKRPFVTPSPSLFSDPNHFAILNSPSSLSPPNKSINLTTEKDHNHPPLDPSLKPSSSQSTNPLLILPPPTPSEGSLQLNGVSLNPSL